MLYVPRTQDWRLLFRDRKGSRAAIEGGLNKHRPKQQQGRPGSPLSFQHLATTFSCSGLRVIFLWFASLKKGYKNQRSDSETATLEIFVFSLRFKNERFPYQHQPAHLQLFLISAHPRLFSTIHMMTSTIYYLPFTSYAQSISSTSTLPPTHPL